MFNSITKTVMSKFTKDDLDKWLEEATNDEDWQVPTNTLHQIANAAYVSQNQQRIEAFINEKLTVKKWKKLLKTLNLVDFLLKNGPPESIQYIKSKISDLKGLETYTQMEGNMDKGDSVRLKTRTLVDLMINDMQLIEQRNRASQIVEKMNLLSIYTNKPKYNYSTMKNLPLQKKTSYESCSSQQMRGPPAVQSSTNLGSGLLDIARRTWNENRTKNALLPKDDYQDMTMQNQVFEQNSYQYNNNNNNGNMYPAQTTTAQAPIAGADATPKMFSGLNIKKKPSGNGNPAVNNGNNSPAQNSPHKPQPKPFVKGQQPLPYAAPIVGQQLNNIDLLGDSQPTQKIDPMQLNSFGNTDLLDVGTAGQNMAAGSNSHGMDLMGVQSLQHGGKPSTSFADPNDLLIEDGPAPIPVDIGFGTSAAYSSGNIASMKKKTSMDKFVPIGGGSTSQPTTPNQPIKFNKGFGAMSGGADFFFDSESTKIGFGDQFGKLNFGDVELIEEQPEMSPSSGAASPAFRMNFNSQFL